MKRFIISVALASTIQVNIVANIEKIDFYKHWLNQTLPIQKEEPSGEILKQGSEKFFAIFDKKSGQRICYAFKTEDDLKQIKSTLDLIRIKFPNVLEMTWRYNDLPQKD